MAADYSLLNEAYLDQLVKPYPPPTAAQKAEAELHYRWTVQQIRLTAPVYIASPELLWEICGQIVQLGGR